jgi:uncharacterized protein YbaP (TraB family)
MLYEVTRDGGAHSIFIFGGGPQPPPDPFDAAPYLSLLETCGEYWNEAPEMGPEVQALALKYGVDPAAPLATWLSDADLARVDAAAEATGANRAVLAACRPWLAAQILKMAHESDAGVRPERSAESVLSNEAQRLGIPVRSEFGDADGAMRIFSGMPRDAEIEYFRWMLDAVEAGPEATRRLAEDWARGDLAASDAQAVAMRRDYPALYEDLVVDRNHSWIERIREMFAKRTRAFICMGGGHLVGDDGVVSFLRREAFTVTQRAV